MFCCVTLRNRDSGSVLNSEWVQCNGSTALQLFCANLHNNGQPQLRLTLDTAHPVPDDVAMDKSQESSREPDLAALAASNTEFAQFIIDSFAGLSAREQRVLHLRLGFGGRRHTLQEVGEEFNLTRERIRQIEAKALRKLRHPSRTRKLRDYLDNSALHDEK